MEVNEIEFINIDTTGNAQDFGDLTQTEEVNAAVGSRTRGIAGGGFTIMHNIILIFMNLHQLVILMILVI